MTLGDGVADSVVAIDVGGTFMKGMVLTPGADRIWSARWDTDVASGSEAVVERIVRFADTLVMAAADRGTTPRGLGIAVPGWVDERHGVARGATNIGWAEVPLRQILQDRLSLPVAIRHDVRAGAVAELRLGAAQGLTNYVFIPIGTGIGAAIVLFGVPFVGDSFRAGELGHMPVPQSATACGCGRVGCLETIASASSIARRYAAITGRPASGARDVAAAVAAGDAVAQQIWADAVDALAQVMLTADTLLDVGHYVIGGGLAMAGDMLFDPLRRAIAQLPHEAPRPHVAAAQLGDDAGCIGAGLAIIDELTAGSERGVSA